MEAFYDSRLSESDDLASIQNSRTLLNIPADSTASEQNVGGFSPTGVGVESVELSRKSRKGGGMSSSSAT